MAIALFSFRRSQAAERATMFNLSSTTIEPAGLQRSLADQRAGACVTFEGWVRNRNEGQPVLSLEYEAYAPLANAEGERILAEARERFALIGAAAVHRVGHLQLGELAVWVGVTAEHRSAAFDACRYIIDEAKARLPIWKKEHYAGGATAWINCATRGEHGGAVAIPPA
jgi:molybdopterin synthase catalytic subunit